VNQIHNLQAIILRRITMKNKILILASVLSILAMFALAVTPAAAVGEKSITFLGATYIQGKGVVFEFKVVGEFSDLPGYVRVGGQQYALSCHFNGKGNLACMATQGLAHFIGQNVQGEIAGYTFSGSIKGGGSSSSNCYSVYDYYPTYQDWYTVGQNCQGSPASAGDAITFYNPDYGLNHNYKFSLTTGLEVCPASPDLGEGYYYLCPLR
jgi:hypothetical protein